MLLTSCTSSQKPSTTEQQPATYDQKYEEAAELVTIMHEQGSFLKALAQKARDGSLSESEEKALRRYNYLQDAISRWAADESPDVGVKEQDREDIDRIIDDHLVNPPPGAWKDAPTSRDKCTEIITRIFNGNRCYVCIVFYNHGPLAASGTNLYLFKYKGQWEIISRSYWIT